MGGAPPMGGAPMGVMGGPPMDAQVQQQLALQQQQLNLLMQQQQASLTQLGFGAPPGDVSALPQPGTGTNPF